MEHKVKAEKSTIELERSTIKKLQALFSHYGDTYNVVILRLMNSHKPDEKEKPQGDE